MTIAIKNPEVIVEIQLLMARLQLPADAVVERVILEAGAWMPSEALSGPFTVRENRDLLT